MASPTSFSDLMRACSEEPGRATVVVPEDWMQGRSVFGGLQAAIALRAMRTVVGDVPLRTVQATFVAPVPHGPVTAEAKVLRTGKSASHVEARIIDGSTTLAIVIGAFGAARKSIVEVVPPRRAVEEGEGVVFPYIAGLTPSFTQHFAARFLRGALPFSRTSEREMVVEVAMREEGFTSEAHVLALADFIPPVALAHLDAPAPGSTLTWMLEVLAPRVDDLPLSGWRVDAELVAARDGYTSQSVMLWCGDRPVAVSRQSMLVFG
ncbi:MAG: thioesterase family protein [Labilithrix sp.]|nr:thioesterase family protein [Labilithrix sp.]